METYKNKFLGISITSVALTEMPLLIKKLIESKKKKTFFYINAYCITLTQSDPVYKDILTNATLVYSGGFGPVIASRILGTPIKERTPTPDFINHFFKIAERKMWTIYLLGTTQDSLHKAAKRIKVLFPKIKIVGLHNGFFDIKEEKKIILDINLKKPKILIVGLGSPTQEKWINNNYRKLNAEVFWGVGAMFDVISGKLPRAPKWIQDLGLEWLYRLFQEPKRLWKRYLIGNVKFVLMIFREKFGL